MYRGLAIVSTVLTVLLVSVGCAPLSRSSRVEESFPDPTTRALAEAVARGDEAEITELVASGADPDATGTDRITLLQWAVKVKSPHGLSALLAAGADPDQLGLGGRAALHDATPLEDAQYVQLLLAGGADPDVRRATVESTPLTSACLERRAATFEALVAAGADVNVVDRLGERPIHTCARTNAGNLVLRLLELGTVPDAENDNGATFQDYYFTYDRKVLNDTSIAEREAVIAWLEAHHVLVIPQAYR